MKPHAILTPLAASLLGASIGTSALSVPESASPSGTASAVESDGPDTPPAIPPATRPSTSPATLPSGQTAGEGGTAPGAEPPDPIRVSFRLADGIRVRGELTAWDRDGIDGSFGPRLWTELDVDDIDELQRRLIDRNDAAAWIELGRTLLLAALDQPDRDLRALRLAERALGKAKRLDPEGAEAAIAVAMEDVDAEIELRTQEREAAEAARLRTLSPEARAWSADKWPELTPEEQETAVLSMKADANRILERAGMQIEPVETEFFLFYSDMPRDESARWVRELDTMYALLAKNFGVDSEHNIFWGKCVIFVFNERDRFRIVEAEAFHQLVPDWVDGLSHPMGPKNFVSFFRQPLTEIFAAVLIHETTHAFMHRYRTPRRLPTWANEGIADLQAAILFQASTVDQQRRDQGLRFIRRGGDVAEILSWHYSDGKWPGEEQIGYPIGYLMIELMNRDRPQEFVDWVNAIKDGKAWRQALEEDFGVTLPELVETFVAYYRVND